MGKDAALIFSYAFSHSRLLFLLRFFSFFSNIFLFRKVSSEIIAISNLHFEVLFAFSFVFRDALRKTAHRFPYLENSDFSSRNSSEKKSNQIPQNEGFGIVVFGAILCKIIIICAIFAIWDNVENADFHNALFLYKKKNKSLSFSFFFF